MRKSFILTASGIVCGHCGCSQYLDPHTGILEEHHSFNCCIDIPKEKA